MEKVKKYAKIFLCIAIALMLLGSAVASVIQSDGGKVTIKELEWETDNGIKLSSFLYVPENATAENPAPAIVTSHGAFNNKEMQDANLIELARRGYVVLASDQPQHGNSDLVTTDGKDVGNSAVYQGVLMISRLPYVDKTRIGVTGHSMGGMSCNSAILEDNAAEEQLISAILINSADATYVDSADAGLSDTTEGEYANVYGSRDVGIISCVFDEFFNKSTDANGEQLSSPYFLESPNAQSFLHFGQDPEGLDVRDAFTIYREEIEGEEAIRVIYRPEIIHPWSHFSARSTAYTIEFFEEALGAPNPIPSSDQVWNIKEAFNCVALVGFAIFIASFTVLMLFTPLFESLRAEEVVRPVKTNKYGKIAFWVTSAAATIFSMVVFLPIATKAVTAAVPQTQSLAIGAWALACGLFSILCMVVVYLTVGKKSGFDLAERGLTMPVKKIGKTILLAVIVSIVAYGCVFVSNYFFKTDFRIWTLAVKTFEADKIPLALGYVWLFLVYYVANSVSNNCFNYNSIGGKRGWVNTLIVSVIAALPAIIMLVVQYGTYFTTNHMAWPQASFSGGNPPMYILWFFPIVFILAVSTAISRVIYKVSRNPYIAGITNAIIITIMTVTNTSTAAL